MRTTTTLRHIGVLAGLLLAGTATGAHSQFSGDPGSGATDTPMLTDGERVRLGVFVLLFLALLTVIFWRLNAAYWKDIK